MLGSFLSIVMVVLTLLITSSVSFTYSSSKAARAGVTGRSKTGEAKPATRDKNSRRGVDNVVVAVVVVGFDLIGMRDFVVEVVGVIKVVEAMA